MKKLMLSCEEATRLEERRKEEGLPVMERMQLSMHISACATCRSYKQLSHKMDQLLGRMMKRNRNGDEEEMPPSKIMEIKEALSDH